MDALSALSTKLRIGPTQENSNFLKTSAQNFAKALSEADSAAAAAATVEKDNHTLVTSLAQSELALETAVSIRNKIVDAYQEIMRLTI